MKVVKMTTERERMKNHEKFNSSNSVSSHKVFSSKGWSDEEFWEAIELLRFNKEDARQTAIEKLDAIPVTYDSTNDYPIMLKVDHVAEVLGISQRKAYDIMDQKVFL